MAAGSGALPTMTKQGMMNGMKVFIEHTGCARRKLDLSKMYAYFQKNGYRIAPEPAKADYILVSTCALKKEEEENSLQILDSYRHCQGKVIVYGCLPAVAPSRYKRSFDFEFISPAEINSVDDHFRHITHRFSEMADANVIRGDGEVEMVSPASGQAFDLPLHPLRHSVRYVRNKYLGKKPVYYLFTSRGCLGNCSYCAARFAIGRLQSKQIEMVVEEFNRGIESGYRDFIIIGDDVGAYGIDRRLSFPLLLSALLAEVDKKRSGAAANARNTIRLCIDEFHPRWVVSYHEDLRELIRHRSIVQMLCPLLSGNGRILALMKRENDMAAIAESLCDLSRLNSRMKLDTKLMAGFPSETEEDFEESLEQFGQLPLSSVTITPYEEKENTAACDIEPKVQPLVVAERVRKAQKYFRHKGIGSKLSCNGQTCAQTEIM